jgi:hypothetical protein
VETLGELIPQRHPVRGTTARLPDHRPEYQTSTGAIVRWVYPFDLSDHTRHFVPTKFRYEDYMNLSGEVTSLKGVVLLYPFQATRGKPDRWTFLKEVQVSPQRFDCVAYPGVRSSRPS